MSAVTPAPTSVGTPALPWPLWCTELELGPEPGHPLPGTITAPAGTGSGTRYRAVRVLLRLHGEALGYTGALLDDAGRVTVSELLAVAPLGVLVRAHEHLAGELPDDVLPPTGLDDLPSPAVGCVSRAAATGDGPTVTVAVCTRDRGQALRTCLERLARLTYPRLDILIVDNAPRDGSTRTVFEACVGGDARFRYAVEPRPGLSWARNRALAEATGELLAYTDDDVEVDPLWVDGLVRGFARNAGVGCVTGLVASATVDGPVEAYFDRRASWGESCTPRLFSLAADGADRLFPYSPGGFGTGANVAFRTDLLRRMGGFDVALGAGTVAAGGEDLDAFVRVVTSGHAVAYEPAALVWHHHRRDLPGLERQMFAYGAGLTAFLVKHLVEPGTRGAVLRRLPVGLARLARIPAATLTGLGPGLGRGLGPTPGGGRRASGQDVDSVATPVRPGTLLAREFAGMLAGPLLYLRSREAARAVAAIPLPRTALPSEGPTS